MKTMLKVLVVMAFVLSMSLQCLALPEVQKEPQYGSFYGTITDIRSGDRYTFIQVDSNENDEVMIFNVTAPVLLFSSATMNAIQTTDFEVGDIIRAFYPSMTPVAQSYPPQMTPQVILRQQEDDPMSAKVDVFNNEGLSSDGSLKINVDDQTEIVDLQGEALKKTDIQNKTLMIFYSFAALSYPAQTAPEKIIVLPDSEKIIGSETENNQTEENQVDENQTQEVPLVIPTEQKYVKNGITYVRLIDIATALGYKVQWEDATKSVTLSRTDGPVSYQLHIGQKMYSFNRALGYFENAPLIYENRTYVEESFAKILQGR